MDRFTSEYPLELLHSILTIAKVIISVVLSATWAKAKIDGTSNGDFNLDDR